MHESNIIFHYLIIYFKKFLLVQLLLMKRGGQIIYAGPLGHQSHKLIEYFEVSIEAFLFFVHHMFWMCQLHSLSIVMISTCEFHGFLCCRLLRGFQKSRSDIILPHGCLR
jgi:hypothetical protein